MSDETLGLIKDIQASVEAAKEEDRKVLNSLQAISSENKDESAKAVKVASEAVEKIAALSTEIADMQQKLVATNASKGKKILSLGEQVIKSDAFANFLSGDVTKLRVQANTIIGQDGSGNNEDTLVPKDYQSGIIPGATRALRVADVIPSGLTTSNAVQYARENVFTNNSAETAEGAQKPESVLTFDTVTAAIATIAHTIKVSKQVLDDAPMLAAYIDQRMRYGVALRYDNQLLRGDGTGQNISGILTAGNHTAFTPTAGDNQLDSLNRMIEAVRLADYQPTAIMLNPADFAAIERIKVGSSDERYVIGDPSSGLAPTIWGLPVVLSNNMTAGTAAVGAFDMAYMIWNRQGVTVEVFNQNEDDVEKNLLTVRAEARGTLASLIPAAVQVGLLVSA